MVVETEPCGVCRRPTLLGEGAGVFPAWYKVSRDMQLLRAGWRDQSKATTADGKTLCTECAATHARFFCALCNTERSGEPQESYGDPAEHLCVPCYETVPAKAWREKGNELERAHRYDFE